jgi:hypothetical protein
LTCQGTESAESRLPRGVRVGTGIAVSLGMAKPRASRKWLGFGFALLVGSAVAGTARAEDDVEKALSVSATLGGENSNSIREANGGAARKDGTVVGFMALLSAGPAALGLSADLSPSVDGIATRTLGALAGARLAAGARIRLLLLGEAGMRKFWDPSDLVFETHVTPGELSLPYVGARVGTTWLVSRHFDLGVMAFFRKDVGTGTMTSEQEPFLVLPHSMPTDSVRVHEVGGVAAGISLQVGFRFDTRLPFLS